MGTHVEVRPPIDNSADQAMITARLRRSIRVDRSKVEGDDPHTILISTGLTAAAVNIAIEKTSNLRHEYVATDGE